MIALFTLVNNVSGKRYDLDYENIADIKSVLRDVTDFNNGTYMTPNKDGKIFTWECFENTCERMKKVEIPVTDY